MGVEKRHPHVKFSRTIRLGKNTDLDNAAAGEVEVGSLRDNGTNIQRWNGTFWENIGSPVAFKDIDFSDSPYSVTTGDEYLIVDATGGNVMINLLPASDVTGRILHVKKIDSSINTVTMDGNGSESIDDALTYVLSSQYNGVPILSDGSEWWIT